MKKKLIILGAVAITAAAAVPALAFENEFHGMYRAYGYLTNAYTSKTPASATTPELKDTTSTATNAPTGLGVTLSTHDHTSSYVEQRARLQYIAKASDDLKLVTHFELDALFGGGTAGKYQSNDAGGLDADQVTLETKNVYIDFNSTFAPVNVKVGIQPWNDAYQGTFGNFDGAGAVVTGKFGFISPSLGWFRVAEDPTANDSTFYPGKRSNDLLVVNVKAAPTKDITLGGSYYYINRETGASAASFTSFNVHTVGADVAAKIGPAALTAFGAYQFGDHTNGTATTPSRDLSAYAAGAIAKINLGAINVNASGLYLSGENALAGGTGDDDYNGWQQLATNGATSYFGASNMWLLIRNNATINTSSALGSADLTKGGRGFIGAFAGVDGAVGKLFYAANTGYGATAEKRAGENTSIGIEINGTVGYKLYDNFSASLNGAYAFLGDGMTDRTNLLPGGLKDAKDPYISFVRLDYAF